MALLPLQSQRGCPRLAGAVDGAVEPVGRGEEVLDLVHPQRPGMPG